MKLLELPQSQPYGVFRKFLTESLTDAARDFTRYIRQRRVNCEPSPDKADLYRCSVDGRDLSSVVLFNGGGRANADATPDLLSAENGARTSGIGIWARR